MVVHAYNPRYSGGTDQEGWQFYVSLGKKLERPHLKKKVGHNGVLDL
jgi:hypothetical protein